MAHVLRKRSNAWSFARYWMWAAVVGADGTCYAAVLHGRSSDWTKPGTTRCVYVKCKDLSRSAIACAVKVGMAVLREDAKRG